MNISQRYSALGYWFECEQIYSSLRIFLASLLPSVIYLCAQGLFFNNSLFDKMLMGNVKLPFPFFCNNKGGVGEYRDNYKSQAQSYMHDCLNTMFNSYILVSQSKNNLWIFIFKIVIYCDCLVEAGVFFKGSATY